MSETAVTIPRQAAKRLPWLLDRDEVDFVYRHNTMAQVAGEYGISKRTFGIVLDAHNIRRRERGERPPGVTKADIAAIVAKLKGEECDEIIVDEASCFDCTERELCYVPGHTCKYARKEEQHGNEGQRDGSWCDVQGASVHAWHRG